MGYFQEFQADTFASRFIGYVFAYLVLFIELCLDDLELFLVDLDGYLIAVTLGHDTEIGNNIRWKPIKHSDISQI